MNEFNPYKYTLKELEKTLKEWLKKPSSHPEIEQWYRNGAKSMKKSKTKSEKDFEKYIKLYEKARELEKLKREDEALEIYLSILDKYIPMGTAYYERPAIIFERKKLYEEAIKICLMAIEAIKNKDFHAPPDEFKHRLKRLINKINKDKK